MIILVKLTFDGHLLVFFLRRTLEVVSPVYLDTLTSVQLQQLLGIHFCGLLVTYFLINEHQLSKLTEFSRVRLIINLIGN